MPSTPTTRNRLEKQAAGENSNTWGAPKLNTVIDLVDASLDGLTTKALTGNYSLSSTNYVDDESRKRVLRFTGTGTFTVTIPGVEKWYIVDNQCTGDLTITTGSGTTAVLPTGIAGVIICDGTNVKRLSFPDNMTISGGIVYINGSAPSSPGQVNIRAPAGSAAFLLDNPTGSERIEMRTRTIAGRSSIEAKNGQLQLQASTDVLFAPGDTFQGAIASDGSVILQGAANFTTSNAANVYVVPGTGQLLRSTSSKRYKNEKGTYIPKGDFRKLQGVTYTSKNEDNGRVYVGYYAEDVFAAGFPEFVGLDVKGRPDDVKYATMVVLHAHVLQGLLDRVDALEARLSALEAR